MQQVYYCCTFGFKGKKVEEMVEKEHLKHWENLKPLILAKWPKLHERDLRGINPLLSEVVEAIHKKYKDMPEQSIIEDIENLSEQILKNS